MRFDEEEDNDRNDYFLEHDGPEKPVVKEPKRPALKPEDPEYWEQPESEWEHLRVRRSRRFWIWIAVAALAIGILWGLFVRYFTPYIVDGVQYGYVERIDKRGDVIKTFEGALIPYKELMDTTRVYNEDFLFSVTDPKVAVQLSRMQFANLPVKVVYSRYHAAVPWRGEQKVLVVEVDSVDPNSILPPEFAPRLEEKPEVNKNQKRNK